MRNSHKIFGHRTRLRKRFERAGREGLEDHELLELMLTYSIARKDTKPLAKELLAKYSGLAGVFDARNEDLEKIPGMGPRSGRLISLVREAAAAYLKCGLKYCDAMTSPKQVADYCRMALGGKSHEVVYALFLDSRNRIVAEKPVGEGTIDQSPVYARRLLEEAITSRASGFILVHNHPSGQVSPSPEDKELTRRMTQVARAIELRFLDHLIVGREGYYSFRESGSLT